MIDLASDKFYHYVIVRDDLPIGHLAAQTIHAAGESAALTAPPQGTHAIALQAAPDALKDISIALAMADIRHVTIREPDFPYCNAITALGIAPQPRSKALSKIVGELRLVGS